MDESEIVQNALKKSEDEDTIEIAEVICEGAPLAVQATKRSSMRYVKDGEQVAISAMGADQAALAETEDAEEGVRAFVERRKGNFKGR